MCIYIKYKSKSLVMSFESSLKGIEDELNILSYINVYIGIIFERVFSYRPVLYISLHTIFVSRTS